MENLICGDLFFIVIVQISLKYLSYLIFKPNIIISTKKGIFNNSFFSYLSYQTMKRKTIFFNIILIFNTFISLFFFSSIQFSFPSTKHLVVNMTGHELWSFICLSFMSRFVFLMPIYFCFPGMMKPDNLFQGRSPFLHPR